MKEILKLKLERPARKKGGDRYSTEYDEENLVIYFPQSISRVGGLKDPLPELTITIEG